MKGLKCYTSFLHFTLLPCPSADFLELAVQFGMVTMFASAYPLVAMFAFMVRTISAFFNEFPKIISNE